MILSKLFQTFFSLFDVFIAFKLGLYISGKYNVFPTYLQCINMIWKDTLTKQSKAMPWDLVFPEENGCVQPAFRSSTVSGDFRKEQKPQFTLSLELNPWRV